MRTVLWIIIITVPIMLLVNMLERFSKEGVDRVEVTRLEEPQQNASLPPGTSQAFPWKEGTRFLVVSYWKDTPITNGVVTDMGMGLVYHSGTSAKEIDTHQAGPDHLSLLVVNYDLKTQKTEHLRFLDVERKGGQITFHATK